MLISYRSSYNRPFYQNQYLKLNLNDSWFKKWKKDVFIFEIKFRIQGKYILQLF
jgi:hypothetical protein